MNRKLRGLLYFLGFQPGGQPKLWLRHLLLRDQSTGRPRKFAERVIFKKNGSIRPVLADWYEKYIGNENSAEFAPYLSFIRGQLADGHLGRAKSLHIVSTPHTEIIAQSLTDSLSATRLIVTRSTTMPKLFSHDLYLIITPQMFEQMPPPGRTILMQMEQVKASIWVTPDYLRKLNNCLAILDYSKDNIESLVRRGIPSRQVFYVPLIPYKTEVDQAGERDIDILFYGALSPRRKAYMDELSKRFNVRIETDLFGENLRRILSRSKIVVNIHYYEDALLETTRILESVRFGAKIVSETARDQTDYASLSSLVTFVPRGDVAAFAEAVARELSSWKGERLEVPESGFSGTRYHVLRALNGIGVLDFNELADQLGEYKLPSTRLVLALPEHSDRYRFAVEGLLPEAAVFHGLRHVDGWVGCALSYKLIAMIALRSAHESLLVYEDDAVLPPDISGRVDAIESYLANTKVAWDVFSGLITDFGKDANILQVVECTGEDFVHTDEFVGMVFCIYGKNMLTWMSDFEVCGDDVFRDTIDRFLQGLHPNCVTVRKPLVGHAEEFSSSIWNRTNEYFSGMISDSSKRLEEAVKIFKSGQDETDTSS